MKMKTISAFAAAAVSALLPLTAGAAPALHSVKHAAKPSKAAVMYRAQCGMTYTAAEAKKDHYICPMDGHKMTLIPQAKAAPVGHKG